MTIVTNKKSNTLDKELFFDYNSFDNISIYSYHIPNTPWAS